MDVTFYRQRELAERAFAEQASSAAARAVHLELADRYRDLIAAIERVTAADQAA